MSREAPGSCEAPPWFESLNKETAQSLCAGGEPFLPACYRTAHAEQQPGPHPQPPRGSGPQPGLQPVGPTSQQHDPGHTLTPAFLAHSHFLVLTSVVLPGSFSLSGPWPSSPSAPSGRLCPEVTFSPPPTPLGLEPLQEGGSPFVLSPLALCSWQSLMCSWHKVDFGKCVDQTVYVL